MTAAFVYGRIARVLVQLSIVLGFGYMVALFVWQTGVIILEDCYSGNVVDQLSAIAFGGMCAGIFANAGVAAWRGFKKVEGGDRSIYPEAWDDFQDGLAGCPPPWEFPLRWEVMELRKKVDDLNAGRATAEANARTALAERDRLRSELAAARARARSAGVANEQVSSSDLTKAVNKVWRICAKHLHPDTEQDGPVKVALQRAFVAVQGEIDRLKASG